MRHPAKFSEGVLSHIEKELRREVQRREVSLDEFKILDPFAGTGRVHTLPCSTVGVELEPEWAELAEDTIVGDATKLPFPDDSFDAICTSPCFGNRLADHHNAQDGSVRHSYTHDLGRKLTEGNAGVMPFRNWQREDAPYRALHKAAWAECARVLKPFGAFWLNVKNFYVTRNGVAEEQLVAQWHANQLHALGFLLLATPVVIETPGLRFGANRERGNEYVMTFMGPA